MSQLDACDIMMIDIDPSDHLLEIMRIFRNLRQTVIIQQANPYPATTFYQFVYDHIPCWLALAIAARMYLIVCLPTVLV